MKYVLTINPGSTSVKYVVFDKFAEVVDEVKFDRKKHSKMQDNERNWLRRLYNGLNGGISHIGIRIVHGHGARGPSLLNSDIMSKIISAKKFAPIHNSIALNVIDEVENNIPDAKVVVSFDTDFHSTIPEYASTYPIKKSLTDEVAIRRYGFHGLAIESALNRLEEESSSVSKFHKNVICAHLGGGCSITAVRDGKSVDTTMGLTPLSGIMMTTRSGSIGPGVIEHIVNEKKMSIKEVIDVLNNESGFYGMTGTRDTIDIIERASKNEEPYKLAVDMFVHQIVKQIFAYYGILQGCDALVFSGGIGYGNTYLRDQVLIKLKIINIDDSNTFVFKINEAMVLFENCKKLDF